MKVLVVYEIVPESTVLYELELKDPADADYIKRYHGNYEYVGEPSSDFHWLFERLETADVLDPKRGKPYSGYDMIVHTGYVL